MKRALVFSGGGSRGAYEIGAWQALQDLGVRIDCVYGTSIGAINAALVAQGDIGKAVDLWDNINLSQILDGVPEDFSISSMISSKREILPFLLEHSKILRVDVSPLEETIRSAVSEERIRVSGIDLNVTTLRVPSMTPVQISIRDMKNGTLTDWLMATSACFPVFPLHTIDGMRYIDGGFYDNLPIDKAIGDGADEIVCVDIHPDFSHPEYLRLPQLIVVKPHSSLGNFLNFDRPVLRRSRRLGYLDTMKAYGRYEGVRYTFNRGNRLRMHALARKFMSEIARFDGRSISRMAFFKGTDNIAAPLLNALCADAPNDSFDLIGGYLRGLELAARCCGCREDCVYDAEELRTRLLAAVDIADSVDVPISERSLKEFREDGSTKLMGYIFRCMRSPLTDREVELLAEYPVETAAALCLSCTE